MTPPLGAGVDDAPYGKPSEFEKTVVRRGVEWLTATRESSINFTPLYALDGFTTPNGLCFERHHGGVAEVDPNDHRLMLHGMVDKPLIFTMDDLKRFPRVSKFHFLECAANGGMASNCRPLNPTPSPYTNRSCVSLGQESNCCASAAWMSQRLSFCRYRCASVTVRSEFS